jgi:membrane-associated phospholipid phosphatase
MKTLTDIVIKNSHFYITNLLLLVCCSLFLLTSTRADGFIILNSFHTLSLKIFFENVTLLGDGLPLIIISFVILLFFKKHRKLALILLIAYITSGVFSQILKALISSPRPSVYFELLHYKYYLDTFANCRIGFRSFPSGHTASAFAVATVLSNYFTKRHIWFVTLLYATLVGYSRIYLAHHFLIDVFAGAFTGIIFGTLASIWYEKLAKLELWKSIPSRINFRYSINNN